MVVLRKKMFHHGLNRLKSEVCKCERELTLYKEAESRVTSYFWVNIVVQCVTVKKSWGVTTAFNTYAVKIRLAATYALNVPGKKII